MGKLGLGFCCLLYLGVGLFGYMAFGNDATQADLISAYEKLDASAGRDHIYVPRGLVVALQFGIGIAITLCFPVMAFELRNAVERVAFPGRAFSWARHAALNFAIVGVSVLVASLVPSISVVLGFTGATTSTALMLILPAAFFLKLDPTPLRSWRKAMSMLQLAVGAALLPLALVAWGLSLRE
jgi:amino acid permease